MSRNKISRFLLPGRLGTGFLLGCAFMLYLAIARKPVFDNVVLFFIDLIQLIH